jgi:hypothetical protein
LLLSAGKEANFLARIVYARDLNRPTQDLDGLFFHPFVIHETEAVREFPAHEDVSCD